MTREEKERIQQKLHRAADATINAYGGNLYYEGVARGLEQAAGIVGKTKCVDAVEIVRCKDCKHFHGDGLECRWGMYAYEDDFCSNGERREADEH